MDLVRWSIWPFWAAEQAYGKPSGTSRGANKRRTPNRRPPFLHLMAYDEGQCALVVAVPAALSRSFLAAVRDFRRACLAHAFVFECLVFLAVFDVSATVFAWHYFLL
jgi:hypothetical protein